MANKFRSDRERDPIPELARLIAQADPCGESAAADKHFHQETASERHHEPVRLPHVPQLPADLNAPDQAHELDGYGHDDEAYSVDDQPYIADKEYQTGVLHVRRRSLALMMIEKVNMIEQSLMALSDAIKSKDGPRFTRAFSGLTGACNSCHAAAEVSFIAIQVPTASPFSDQSFSPKGK